MKYQHIVLIDDDEDDQEIFTTAVAQIQQALVCTVESNAANALHKLVARQLLPDVIFLDLNMPVMNGMQFLEQIKKHPEVCNIPIIIFSTTSHEPTIKKVKLLGANHFLTKPSTYNDLVDLLKPLL